MEAAVFLKSLAELKKQYAEPVSHVRVLSDLMYRTSQPVVFTEAQRKVFVANIDRLSAFLESEEGEIATELLVDAFQCYVDQQKSSESELELEE